MRNSQNTSIENALKSLFNEFTAEELAELLDEMFVAYLNPEISKDKSTHYLAVKQLTKTLCEVERRLKPLVPIKTVKEPHGIAS